MIKGLYASSNGMPPMMVKLEVIANNLANINTSGFKKDGLFVQMMNDPGIAPVVGAGKLSTRVQTERVTDFSEGSLVQTSNPLDLALQGRGFFVVQTPQGTRYTRNGNFTIALDGTLTTGDGFPVLAKDGTIKFPDLQQLAQESVRILPTGEIHVGTKAIGALRIVDFEDTTRLQKAGGALFSLDSTDDTGMHEVELPTVRQGYLEESNVDGIAEMIEMIEITRHFESNQKAIASQDATLEKVLEVGKFS
ncbi:MAG: flagellar basal-body rod protein FlgF [Ignavibacteria bacterium]